MTVSDLVVSWIKVYAGVFENDSWEDVSGSRQRMNKKKMHLLLSGLTHYEINQRVVGWRSIRLKLAAHGVAVK